MNRKKRVEIATDTLKILEKGFYTNSKAEKVDITQIQEDAENNTKLYTPAELDRLISSTRHANSFETRYEVENETTLDAARRLAAEGEENVMVLNFASAKNPGGGFLGGSLAQEECIARATGMYPCLLQANEYYEYHRQLNTCLYSDHMIYSPLVPVLKTEDGEVLDEVVCISIITSPAVNAGAVRNNQGRNIDSIVPVMRKRVEKLLALSLHHKHTTLVLGAWGCGVFRNDPEDIAELFRDALTGSFANQFKRVVFAVKTSDENIIEPFRERFK